MTTRGVLYFLAGLATAILCAANGAATESPVAVPVMETSFEEGSGSYPDGWELAYGTSAGVEWSSADYRTGTKSVHLYDQSATAGYGLRCEKIRVEPYDHIGVVGYYKSSAGDCSIFIDFWDAQGARMTADKMSFPVSSSGGWTQFSRDTYVPEGATHATILLYSGSTTISDGYFDDVDFQWWPFEGDPILRPIVYDSFEDGDTMPYGWAVTGYPAGVIWSTDVSLTGSHSIRILDTMTTAGLGLKSDQVGVRPGDVVEGFGSFYADQYDTASIYIDFYDINGDRMTEATKSFGVSSDGAWEDFSTTTTVPDGACSATLWLYSYKSATTDGYFDEVGLICRAYEYVTGIDRLFYDSFESGEPLPAGLPDGWNVDYGTAGAFEWVDTVHHTSGQSIHIADDDSGNYGIRSDKFGVTPGDVCEAKVWFYSDENDTGSLYLEYWDASGTRIDHQSFYGASDGSWIQIGGDRTVPAGATSATVLLYSSTANLCDGYFDDVTLKTWPDGEPQNVSTLFETSFYYSQEIADDVWSIDFGSEANFEWCADAYSSGTHCVHIVDESDTLSAGIRSMHIDVTPGDDVWVKVWYTGIGTPSVYFEYWDTTNTRFDAQSYGISGGTEEWRQSKFEDTVPEGAVTATVLLYSSSTSEVDGYFDDCTFGTGFEPTHDRTIQPVANVSHPAGPISDADIQNAKDNVIAHTWAASVKQSTKSWADWWKNRSSGEDLEYWIPRLTPFRAVDCPACQAGWSYAWTAIGGTHVRCRNCGTVFPNREYPETETEMLVAPTGAVVPHTCYKDPVTGLKYRLSGLSRYRRTIYLSYLDDLARYYVLSDDSSYAEVGAKILRRLAEVYPDWIMHDWYNIYSSFGNLQSGKICGWKLYDARMILGAGLLYDAIYDSGYLSAEDKELIETNLLREFAEMCMPVAQHGCCYNDGTYQMSAVAYVGALLGDHRYVQYAVSPPGGFLGFMHDYYFRDGHWQDGSPSYESMVTEELYQLPEILRGYSDPLSYTGADRFDNLDVTLDPMVKKVHLTPLFCMFPDETLPPTNDSAKGKTYNKRHAEVQYNWYPTEKNLEILNWVYDGNIDGGGTRYSLFRRDPDQDFSGISQMCLSSATLVRPGLGQAFLREGSGATRTDLVLDYGEPSAWHGHPDRLNFLLWAAGHEVVTDLGYLGARHPFRPWMAHGVCHNLVMVDGVDQAREHGKLILCASGPKVQAVVAEAPDTYSQCSRYERNLVLMTPDSGVQYVVDVFNVSGGDQHDLSFHGEGTTETFSCAALASAVAYPGAVGPEAGGYDWFEDVQFTSATGEIVADWRLGDLYPGDPTDGVRLRMLDTSGNLINGKGPNLRDTSDPYAEPMLDFVIQRRPGPTNTFVSVVEPVDDGSTVVTAASVLSVSETHSGTFDSKAVKVTHSSGVDYIIVTPDPARNVTVSDNGHTIELTGRLGVASFDDQGDLRFLWAADGDTIDCDGYDLSIPPTVTGDITAIDDENDTFVIDADMGNVPFGWTQWYAPQSAEWSDAEARGGCRSIHIDDSSTAYSSGLRSPKIRANAGDSITLTGYAKAVSGSASIFFEYWNSSGTRIATSSSGVGAGGDWTQFSKTHTAPANTYRVSFLLYSSTTGTFDGYFDDLKATGYLETSFEDGLAGNQIIAQAWCDGAYEMDRFTDDGTTTTIHLRDEPIITVEPPEAFRIPYWSLWELP